MCALMARFDHAYRRSFASHPQARGRIFHRVAARCLTEMATMGEPQIEIDVAKAILTECLRQHDVDRECPLCGSDRIRKGLDRMGRRRCLACGERFETGYVNVSGADAADLAWVTVKWAMDNTWSIEDLYEVEERLRWPVAYPNPHGGYVERMLTGQLDALFVRGDAATVIDFKDTWAMPGPSEVSEEGYFQQRFYAWLVMHNHRQIDRVTLREQYVRYGESREATITRERLDDLDGEFAALAERFDRSFEEKLFPPTPGKHCSWCCRPEACPIPTFAREEGRIVTAEQAEQAARQVIVAETVVKKKKAQVAAWTNVNGPIQVKDAKGVRMWGHREAERESRPTREALSAALAAGGRVDVDALYTKRKGTRFEVYVPSPGEEAPDGDAAFAAQLAESVEKARAAKP